MRGRRTSGGRTSLRAVLTASFVGMAAVTLTAAVALAAMTARMHASAVRLERETSAAHEIDRAAGDLLLLARTHDAVVRQELRADVLRSLERHGEPTGGAAIGARAALDAYFAELGSNPDPAAALGRAYGELRRVGDRWYAASARSLREVARWDRAGDVLGTTIAAVLAASVLALLWWLRRRAFRPLSSLVSAMDRFAEGDRAARADAGGPAELAAIAQQFNVLADALARRREQQLSFLGGVAHDLRTPLSALQLSLAAAMPGDRPTPPLRLRTILALAGRQVSRIERMLTDLLEVVRSEHGALRLELEDVDARRLCEDVLGLFAASSPRHRLRLVAGDGPVCVHADPQRLEQVLVNLVSNATKYSPDGGEVSIELEPSATHLRVHVTDEGIGVDPAEAEQLFEPYRRSRRTDGIPGSGLGLFVVKKIVEAHGGTVSVAPGARRGTRFTVELPARPQGARLDA
jgi:signal transduction histidine kinase